MRPIWGIRHFRGMVFWASLVGFFSAVVVAAFRECMVGFEMALMGASQDFVLVAEEMDPWQRVFTPVLGALLAGLTLQYGMRLVKGSRAPTDYMEAFNVGDGHISIKASLIKSTCSLFSICSGGSMGREGAMVQLSAMVGSTVCRILQFPASQRRILVACGAAGGLASAYNAPLAATVFVAEIVVGSISFSIVAPIIVSAVIADATMHDLLGFKPIFSIPDFSLVSGPELFLYLLVGAVAGRMAPLYLTLLKTASTTFAKLPGPVFLRFTLGGLGLGLISLLSPKVWGNGHSVVDSIFNDPWTWQALAALFVLKILATASTVGSGAVGGVFTPTCMIGATLGGVLGAFFHHLAPLYTGPVAAYALVGMGAFLAATTRAPLMAILMLFEMTRDYDMMLPLMIACMAANYIALPYGATMYTEALKREHQGDTSGEFSVLGSLVPGPPLAVKHSDDLDTVRHHLMLTPYNHLHVVDDHGRWLGVLRREAANAADQQACAADLLQQRQQSLHAGMTLQEALHAASQIPSELLPVVEKETSRFLGTVSKSELLNYLERAWRHDGAGEPEADDRSSVSK